MKNPQQHTSWENVHDWYDKGVGSEGHYYHRQIILPRLKEKWQFDASSSFLDLACGQGIIGRQLGEKLPYVGIDISPALIKAARKQDAAKMHQYLVRDITQPIKIERVNFSHAALILSLQNLADPLKALCNAAHYLQKGGLLTLVINHPCFRVPRQSSWGIDDAKKWQYRRIDRYMSPLKIPIQVHPGSPRPESETLSFHWPLSQLSSWLHTAGFMIGEIEEWCSDKESEGAKAKMENRSRQEFPLFMALFCVKHH